MPARRLLVLALTALATGCLSEVETTPPSQRTPVLLPATTALGFAGRTDQPSPAAQAVLVHNGGGGTLARPTATCSTTSGGAWLSATVDGTAPPYTVTVAAARASLVAGTYAGAVRLESAGAKAPRTIAVTFTLRDPVPPTIVPSPAALAFAALAGDARVIPAQAVTVTNGGDLDLVGFDAQIDYGAGPGGWLSATPGGTAPPYTVTVQPTTGTLAAGTYAATVRLTATAAAPVDVPVTFTVSAPRPVTVTRLLTYWKVAGADPAVADPALQSVALAQDDGAGGLLSVPATQAPPGTWTAVVGPGPYWAVLTWSDGTQYWVRSAADALDMGDDVPGRANRVALASPTTTTLTLSRLLPWAPINDALQLTSWDAVAFHEFSGAALGLQENAESITGATFDWKANLEGRLDPADVVYVTQFREKLSTDLPGNRLRTQIRYRRVETWTEQGGLAMTDGAPFALAPTRPMSLPTDLSGTLRVVWDKDELEAALPRAGAVAANAAHRIAVHAVVSPKALGPVSVPLLDTSEGRLATGWDPDCGTLAFARFLPAAFKELVRTSFQEPATRTAPGASTGVTLQNGVQRWDALSAAPNPVRPQVRGVPAITLGGADVLGASRSGVSATATLAWTAPAAPAGSTGNNVTSYLVEVRRIFRSGTETSLARSAEAAFFLTGTSLAFPPGLLQAGQTYLARVVARGSPGDAATPAAPLRVDVPYAEASVWTQPFTVAP